MRRRPTHFQRGQAIVLVALSIVALTGMVALSVDVGNSFTQRRLLQTAADAAAMAGAHLGLEQIIYVKPLDYQAQKNAAIKFAGLNGITSPPDNITIVWVDGAGVAFSNDINNLPTVPPGKIVQGMKVTIAGDRSTFLFQTFGISTVRPSVTAMAQYGTPSALIGAIPLALNNDTVPRSVPLNPASPPILYQPVLMQLSGPSPACCTLGQIDSAGKPIPGDFIAPAPPVANFFILHDKPTDYASAALAREASTHYGLKSTLQLGVYYYAELLNPTVPGFGQGLLDRIIDANNNPVFNPDTPTQGGFHPLNPRVFIVGINADAGPTPCTPPCPADTTSLKMNEFLAFYTQFVLFDNATPAAGVTIGGYFVMATGVPGNNGFGDPNANGPKIFRLSQ
jgi:Flp pilus assembly protein TadG